jgi:GT2 family glycosyltransferase
MGRATSAGEDLLVAVVVATRDRRARLQDLLEALERQTLDSASYEVVVVDDASTDGTERLLAEAARSDAMSLRVIRRDLRGGPAVAREEGWRSAAAGAIAFTDDDCVPAPDWLERGLDAMRRNGGAIVQGSTEPTPSELAARGPFSRVVRITELDPSFQTCNLFYPRALLERVGGFDTEGFGPAPGGEDSDLAWRAIKAGAVAIFEPTALVHHAVERGDAVARLRYATRWTTPMLAYARHPELRRAHFVKGVFWKGSHYLLIRALCALVVPRRLRWLRPWLAGPYLATMPARLRADGASPLLVPYYVVYDLVEISMVLRAALRYRRFML